MTHLLVITDHEPLVEQIQARIGQPGLNLKQCRPERSTLDAALQKHDPDLCILVEDSDEQLNQELLGLLGETLQPFLMLDSALAEELEQLVLLNQPMSARMQAFITQLHNNLEWVQRIQSFVPLFENPGWPDRKQPSASDKEGLVAPSERLLVSLLEQSQEGFALFDQHWSCRFISAKLRGRAPDLAQQLQETPLNQLVSTEQLDEGTSKEPEAPCMLEFSSDLGSLLGRCSRLPQAWSVEPAYLLTLSGSPNEAEVFVPSKSIAPAEEMLHQLAEHIPYQFYVKDTQLKVVNCNEAYSRFLGASDPSEVLGSSEAAWPELGECVAHRTSADQAVIHSGEPDLALNEIYQLEGKAQHIFRIHRLPLLDSNQQLIGVMGIQEDVSERRRIEQAHRESEAKLRLMLEHAPNILLTLDLEGHVTYLNRSFLATDAHEMIGQLIDQFYSIDEAKKLRKEVHAVIQEGKYRSFELNCLGPENRELIHQVNMGPINEGEGVHGVFLVLTDITDHKQAESESLKLAMAIQQAAEIVVVTDRRGNIEYVNPAFERITGYRRDEVIGKNPRLLKSGKQDEGFYRKMWGTLSNGKVWTGRLTNRKKNGELYEEELTISPVRDDSGRIVNYVGVKRDTTYEERLKRQLWQNQKLEAIGTLAGGIAHDFNNLLGTILLNLNLLGLMFDENEQAQRYLNRSQDAGNRAKELIKQILTFSRQKEQAFQVMDVVPIFKETVKFIQNTLPPNIGVREQISMSKAYINCDPTQLHQVLMNLATNAAYAMQSTGGTLQIRLNKVVIQQKYAPLYNIQPGHYMRLTLTDNGEGMSKQTREHIFEPFYTTKPVGEGTGMGLSIVHGIVRNHQGAISVYSERNQGTTFNIFLPLAQGEQINLAAEPVAKQRQETRVLLVDDEEMFVQSEQELLERFGYQVTSTTDPMKALELFRNDTEAYDVVITDHNMPGLKGDELSKELTRLRSDLPVILVTGFSEFRSNNKLKSDGIQEVLLKPIITDDLMQSIDRLATQGRRSHVENPAH